MEGLRTEAATSCQNFKINYDKMCLETMNYTNNIVKYTINKLKLLYVLHFKYKLRTDAIISSWI